MIKTWNERCQEHPAHASGMITHDMIQMRMQEEIDALRAALAQPEPEPVAWWDGKESVVFTHDEIYTPNWTDYWTQPLYTTPPQPDPVTLEAVYETIIRWDGSGGKRSRRDLAFRIVSLFAAPSQRKPLSEATIDTFSMDKDGLPNSHLEFARAIEAAHGIGGEHE